MSLWCGVRIASTRGGADLENTFVLSTICGLRMKTISVPTEKGERENNGNRFHDFNEKAS